MNSKFLFSTAMAASLVTSVRAATTLLNDNFDSYASDTAFGSVWTADSTTAALSTVKAFSGTQSVLVGTAAQRNYRDFTATTATASHPIDFSFEFYDTAGSAAAYREYAEIDSGIASSGNGQIISLGLNNNIASSSYMARVVGYDGGSGTSAFFKLNGTGAPARSTGWHKLEMIDYGSALDFYVDGVKSFSATGVTVQPLGYVKVGSNLSATSNAYFDNVSVSILDTPEPASIGLLSLPALLCSRRRR